MYFDVAPPFGLRSAAMMCQRTTSAVSHMFGNLGYQCTNYIDDFGGAGSPSKATMAFETLDEFFSILSLDSSPEKDCTPSTCMAFLGVQFNTIDITMSVTWTACLNRSLVVAHCSPRTTNLRTTNRTCAGGAISSHNSAV